LFALLRANDKLGIVVRVGADVDGKFFDDAVENAAALGVVRDDRLSAVLTDNEQVVE
jgi:hypothetical protein